MMPINPILAAAAADILVGMFLYSDYGFGKLWSKVTGMKCNCSKDFLLRMAAQIVSSLMIATALYIAILTLKKTELPQTYQLFTQVYSWFFTPEAVGADLMSSLKIAGFFWLGFNVPLILSKTVWASDVIHWKKGALKAVFQLAQFLAMAGALAYFG